MSSPLKEYNVNHRSRIQKNRSRLTKKSEAATIGRATHRMLRPGALPFGYAVKDPLNPEAATLMKHTEHYAYRNGSVDYKGVQVVYN
jgi:hypothetical protein